MIIEYTLLVIKLIASIKIRYGTSILVIPLYFETLKVEVDSGIKTQF